MDWKIFGTAFITLFLAELGDKTQLAVITMTSSTESKVSVFLGAASALVAVTLLGVLLGGVLSQYVPTEWLQRIVAVAFIVIGVLMLAGKLLQPCDKLLPKLRYLWCNDSGAVRLVRIIREIFLMIILSRPEFVEGGDLGDDRVVVDRFGCDLGDHFVRGFALSFGMVKDR